MVAYVTLPIRIREHSDPALRPTAVVLASDGHRLVVLGAAPWTRGLASHASTNFLPGDPATSLGAFCMRALSSYAPVLGPWELDMPLQDAVTHLAQHYELPVQAPARVAG